MSTPAAIDRAALERRPPEVDFEPFERKPFDIFFLDVGGHRFVGHKREATLRTGGPEPLKMKCCLVEASMLLGLFVREQLTQEGISVFYRPMSLEERQAVFAAFTADARNDLYYPYTHLVAGTREERTAPPEYWKPTPRQMQHLDAGEVVLREHTLRVLTGLGITRGTVYDPACSTGEFLGSLKAALPGLRTVAQDLSPEMVEVARGRVDEIHVGDAWDSPVPPGSMDVVFFRLLNFDVMTTRRAHELLPRVANRCRDGGRLIVFGHTPVLVGAPFFERLGLTVERCSASEDHGRVAFQYYVLRKERPLPVVGPLWSDALAARASG
ncbi:class I SAM-dependent methyltransferase [Pyxidicoccus trucidator]|uniref:class I SAM-dependent methyltransferase n=1 Tax=Pyxidicoccus trucidator TaxID=2709662 RepID=UPI0013D938E1|nr:class I SAM-dependent methyltransferase [Pyxidicoccus trucidator]